MGKVLEFFGITKRSHAELCRLFDIPTGFGIYDFVFLGDSIVFKLFELHKGFAYKKSHRLKENVSLIKFVDINEFEDKVGIASSCEVYINSKNNGLVSFNDEPQLLSFVLNDVYFKFRT